MILLYILSMILAYILWVGTMKLTCDNVTIGDLIMGFIVALFGPIAIITLLIICFAELCNRLNKNVF